MLNKKEVIEMMFRPTPMPDSMLQAITATMMNLSTAELIETFTQSTKLQLVPMSGNLFSIKYNN
jgi:hypothetical protein